jgi:hypothetical protein
MENRSLKIFLACATGAGIGTLVAIEIGHNFWWIGALVGGLIGYLVHEFKEVIEAVKDARRWVAHDFKTLAEDEREIWKEMFGFKYVFHSLYKEECMAVIVAFVFLSNFFIPIMILVSSFDFLSGDITVYLSLIANLWLSLSLLLGRDEYVEKSDFWSMVLVVTLPVLCYFFLVRKNEQAKVPIFEFFKIMFNFVRRVVILIHSEVRLLCGIVATLGATIGYFSGSAIIGALAGGVIGVIYYKIVSEWMLGLRPAS